MGYERVMKNNWQAGDPIRAVANAHQANFYANFVNDLQGIGCRVVKPDKTGMGCRIIVGDGSSDVNTEDLDSDWQPDAYYLRGAQCRVNSNDKGAYLEDQFQDYRVESDTEANYTGCKVYGNTVTSGADRLIELRLPYGNGLDTYADTNNDNAATLGITDTVLATTPEYSLSKDTDGNIGWGDPGGQVRVYSGDTPAYLEDQIRNYRKYADTTANYSGCLVYGNTVINGTDPMVELRLGYGNGLATFTDTSNDYANSLGITTDTMSAEPVYVLAKDSAGNIAWKPTTSCT